MITKLQKSGNFTHIINELSNLLIVVVVFLAAADENIVIIFFNYT